MRSINRKLEKINETNESMETQNTKSIETRKLSLHDSSSNIHQ